MERYLRKAVAQRRPDGSTKSSLVLKELARHADAIPYESIGELIATVLCLGEELDVAADDAKAFGYVDGERRRYQLVGALTRERLDLLERSAMLLATAHSAALSTLVHFAYRVRGEHHDDDRDRSVLLEDRLMTPADAEECRKIALHRLTHAAASGELIHHRQLVSLLYCWWSFADDSGEAARSWANAQLEEDGSVVKLATAFRKVTWTHSDDDAVSVRNIEVEAKALEELIDGKRLRERCEEVLGRANLSPVDAKMLSEFLEAWRRTEVDPDF